MVSCPVLALREVLAVMAAALVLIATGPSGATALAQPSDTAIVDRELCNGVPLIFGQAADPRADPNAVELQVDKALRRTVCGAVKDLGLPLR